MKKIRKLLILFFAVLFVAGMFSGCSGSGMYYLEDSLLKVKVPSGYLVATQTDSTQLKDWIVSKNDATLTEENFKGSMTWNSITLSCVPKETSKWNTEKLYIQLLQDASSKEIFNLTSETADDAKMDEFAEVWKSTAPEGSVYSNLGWKEINGYRYIKYDVENTKDDIKNYSYVQFTIRNGYYYYYKLESVGALNSESSKDAADLLVKNSKYITSDDLPKPQESGFNWKIFLYISIPGSLIFIILWIIVDVFEKRKKRLKEDDKQSEEKNEDEEQNYNKEDLKKEPEEKTEEQKNK